MNSFNIILKDGLPKNWVLAADTLVHAIGMNKGESSKACRHGYGLIQFPFRQEQADAGAIALTQVGLAAKSIEVSELISTFPTLTILSATVEADALVCQSAQGVEPFRIPASSVRAIFVGYLLPSKRKSEKEVLAEMAFLQGKKKTDEGMSDLKTGLAVGAMLLGGGTHVGFIGAQILAQQTDPRNAGPAPAIPRTPEVCIDLLCTEPPVRLRMTQRKYNYQSLGSRLLPNMRGNFRLVVNDLLAALPHALQIGQIKEATSAANLEQENFIRADEELSLEYSVILTRDALFRE